MKNASFLSKDHVAVSHTVRPDVNREFLSWPITGWDDIAPITRRVLLFEGREFTYCSWNSDNMTVSFVRGLTEPPKVATFKN